MYEPKKTRIETWARCETLQDLQRWIDKLGVITSVEGVTIDHIEGGEVLYKAELLIPNKKFSSCMELMKDICKFTLIDTKEAQNENRDI